MRTNGFIFIALGLTAIASAGTPGYLPAVGPVALRFDSGAAATPVVVLPAPAVITEVAAQPASRLDVVADIPVETPTNATPATTALMHDVPVVLPENSGDSPTNGVQNFIAPVADTNGLVTPQMFLRFFTPAQGGVSREAVIVTPPGFNPARPPTPSSTATYSQPKP